MTPKTREENDPQGFAALGLAPTLLGALTALGYEEPTPIQREAIPPLVEGRDLLGQAATGTGKTAAFALPILQRIVNEGKGTGPTALVLVPTRELAMQVSEAVHRYGKALGVRVLPVYGGQPIGRQLHAMRAGVDVVIATPGRALDHLRRGSLDMTSMKVVVLDEADEMLDMGFAEDIEAVLASAPAERQTVLFSATMPPRIEAIAKRNQRDPVRIKIAKAPPRSGEVAKVRQQAYMVKRDGKLTALSRILDLESPKAAIVFCRSRLEVDELAETLNARGYPADGLHGGLSQEQRDRVMKRLRAGGSQLLVATDVAARGLDVDLLTHVFNYDLPSAAEAYVHRIGRVGRAGREGVAITFVEPREQHLLRNIERLLKHKIEFVTVPTVADLQARRIEVTRASLQQAMVEEEANEHFRVIVDSFSGEYDPMQVAMAAVRLYHQSTAGEESEKEGDVEPALPPPSPYGARPGRAVEAGMAKLYIAAGRLAGIRPQDLVGAIANEAGVAGKQIGAIQITDKFSIVEVEESRAEAVIKALRNTKIKGKKVSVRLDRA